MASPRILHGAAGQRGAALLLSMLFTAAAISMLLMLSTRTVAHVRQAEYATLTAAAFAAAEAAGALARADLERGGGGNLGYRGGWGADARNQEGFPRFDDPEVEPRTFSGEPVAAWYTITAAGPGLPPDTVVVYAVARVGSVERRLEWVLRRTGPNTFEPITWREWVPGEETVDAGL